MEVAYSHLAVKLRMSFARHLTVGIKSKTDLSFFFKYSRAKCFSNFFFLGGDRVYSSLLNEDPRSSLYIHYTKKEGAAIKVIVRSSVIHIKAR